jgi:MFS family permease
VATTDLPPGRGAGDEEDGRSVPGAAGEGEARPHELTAEDAEDAFLDGDRQFEPGTARSALSHRSFRIFFLGAFASNIGTWMQNAVLGAYAYDVTGSPSFVGLLVFAQLGPLLIFSTVGGVLADEVDRRLLLIGVAIQQLIFSVALAVTTSGDDPNRVLLVGLVLIIGIGQAIHAPAYSSLLPQLVPRDDLAGAVALNSTQMNASRVIGPTIGSAIYAGVGVGWVFGINALTYVAVIVAVLMTVIPPVVHTVGPKGVRRLVSGFGIARRNPVVARCLVTMTLFSFFCLPFVTQMPVLAHDNLGIDPDSVAYGALYACLGIGAVLGSLSIGTVFSKVGKRHIACWGLVGFSGAVAVLALIRVPGLAYPATVVVGFAYFATVTSLATVLQQDLDDAVRGRVMALWIMSFGGTVPIGGLVFGPVVEATSITLVMLVGAFVALLLGLEALRARRLRLQAT